MRIVFSENSWNDYVYWQTQDKKTLKRINKLIKEIQRNSFEGLGKPEPLKGSLQGYWSRRIDQEHRLVYKITENEVLIASCRYHYEK